jgi:serine protease AprX
MRFYSLFLLCIVFCTQAAFAQSAAAKLSLDRYRIDFTDKKGTLFSIANPSQFLSPRAIERRRKYGIPINLDDLPIAERYLTGIKNAGGKVLVKSRWFNSVAISADTVDIEKIRKLPFVRSVKAISRSRRPRVSNPGSPIEVPATYHRLEDKYGYGRNQIEMLNGTILHEMGYDGRGMLIAIFDGGFQNANVMPFFDSLRNEERIYATHDFVNNGEFVFDHSTHGTNVLSTMAANFPGLLVGTAPKASYVLLKTEDVGSESLIEEDNWVAAAEYSDSIGVDVINSSLGYTTFEYPQLNYKYQDLNGRTSRATKGANKAAFRGILVVNSAGNSGGDEWRFVGVPADADSVLTIGAVDRYGERAYFSSFGPTADGRIKPNVAARGFETVVGSLNKYAVDSTSGTSFSSPVMAGMVTSLWSAVPTRRNMDVMRALMESGSQAERPDNGLGWGIPDVYKAYYLLADGVVDATGEEEHFMNTAQELSVITRNPLFKAKGSDRFYIRITNLMGDEVYSREDMLTTALSQHKVQFWNKLPAGGYHIFVRRGRSTFNLLVMKVDEGAAK